MTRLRLFTFMLQLCCFSRGSFAENTIKKDIPHEKILLQLGSSQEIQLAPESSLRLSQKKIVEIETLSPERFRLLAVRKGIVYLRALSAEGLLLRSWLLEVEAPSPQELKAEENEEEWYAAFCLEKGVSCVRTSRTVRGETESLSWLHRMRKRCEKEPPCRFEVQLSAAAQDRWRDTLEQEWGQGPLELAADGFVISRSSCKKDDTASLKTAVESFRNLLATRYGAPFIQPCRRQEQEAYVLDIVALAQRSDGAQRDNPLDWQGLALPPELPFKALIRGLSESGRAHILAQPLVQLSEGGEVLISDGFEIQTLAYADGRSESAWKAVGFTLRCAYLEQREDKAHVKIELQLSRPRSGNLDMSRLETETWLKLQQWQLVGRIQARTDGEEHSALPWFVSIPFLGPLFRWSVDQKATSEVSLFVRMRSLNAEFDQSQTKIDELGQIRLKAESAAP